MERRDTTTRIAVSQLIEARSAGDVSGVAAMLREIRANDVETAKMLGLYEPERVDVSVSTDPTAILADARDRWLQAIAAREQQQLSSPILEAEVVE